MKRILLILIIILAFGLRFYRLGDYPALNADEAAIGYNAYSLIQTGLDEHGNPWPIHFQSFNDFKPGLYFYLVLPLVRFMGLNPWAVRIPGAAAGVLTVLVVYLLVRELFADERLSLFSALFLAISPWHIHFSRGGWEVNVSTFFIALGVLMFVRAIKKPSVLTFAFSLLSFILSLYTYHAARIIVPLLGLGLVIIYRKIVLTNVKKILLAGLVGLILLVPLIRDLAGPAGLSRAAGVGLFADPGPLARINEQRGEHANYLGMAAKLYHNKAVNYTLAFLENWGKHYWGEFLFLSGDDIQRNKVPETGQMYLFDIFFLAAGLIAIAKKPKGWAPILLWLAVAPTAAALTFQSPHALRAENMVVPLAIISACGLSNILDWLKNSPNKKCLWVGSGLLVVVIAWNFARYEHLYWVHMAKEYPFSSQYGLRELAAYVETNQSKYQKIIVTNRYDQPYILFLFYLKYPPAKFQKEHVLTPRDKYGFSTVEHFDKYYFGPLNFDKIQPANPNSLIIGTDEEIPKEANIVKKIYGSNGYLYFDIVAN